MKRLTITTVLSFVMLLAFGQVRDVMVIEKNDGTKMELNVNDIKRATFKQYEETTEEETAIPLVTSRTLVVTLTGNGASAASVSYAGITGTRSGNNVIFENAPVSGAISVTGASIIPQNVNINFGERSTLVIEVNTVLPSTNIAPQTQVEIGADVTNDTNNQASTGVSANLNLGTNGSVASYASGLKDYSLTVFTPTAAPESTISPSVTYIRAPYSVVCKPDGTAFSPAAHIELYIPSVTEIGLEGISFRHATSWEDAQNMNVKDGDVVAGDLPHFSTWNIGVVATCISATEERETIAMGSLVNGANNISFNQKCGFQSYERGIIAVWLRQLFGSALTNVAKTTTINATSAGSYEIYQKKYTYTFKAGYKVFQATTYGEVFCNVKY